MIARALLVLAVALLVAGCALPEGAGQPSPASPVDEAATPTDQAMEPTSAPAEAEEPPAAASDPAASDEMVKALANTLGVAPEALTVLSVEPVNWPDTCLGVTSMDIMCGEAITPGYRIVVEVDGAQTTLHTNQDLSVIYLADASEEPAGAAPDAPVLIWQSGGESCAEAHFNAETVLFGPCGPRLDQLAPLSADRTAELATFAALYASYSAETPAGAVSLTGNGPARAEAADQRALAQWAEAVVAEVIAEQPDPRAGLAMEWSREGGFAGFCDQMLVYGSGQAPASSCKTTPASMLGARWLSSPQMALLFGWIDGLSAFQYQQKDQATADAMAVALSFAGRGAAEASAADQQALLDYAHHLFTFGALATGTRYVVAAGDLPMLTGPGEQFPPVGELFGGQTAFVTGVSQDGRWWRVLCPDDTVGDCWLAADKATPQAETPPAVAPASYDPADIYATVIRQLYTVDHTFGQPPNFPTVYLVRRTDDSVGASGSPANGQTIAPSDQTRITAQLADLPAQWIWVDSAADAPRDANGSVVGEGAVITVGNIAPRPDGTLHVPAGIFIGMLAAGGQTYVLESVSGVWQITGVSGPVWIS